MGGIVETGLTVTSDRSGKKESVTDEKQVEWYKNFAKTKDKDDLMIAIIVNGPASIVGDEPKVIEYEYVTPKELETILGYVSKCDPPKPRKRKDSDEDKKPEGEKADEGKKTEGDKKGEEKKGAETPDLPDRDAGAEEPGDDVDEDELFDD